MEYLSQVLVFMLIACCLSQKTYRRGCECEYTVDGKCAYTLMLPVDKGSNQMSTCAETDTAKWSKDMLTVQEHLRFVNNNITNILSINSQQAQSLNVLQSVVLAQTILVQNLTARVDSLPGCEDCKVTGTCDECNAVRAQVAQQWIPLQALEKGVQDQTARIDAINTNVAPLVERSEDIITVVDKFRETEKTAETLRNEWIVMKARLDAMALSMPCRRRGLVVSGPDEAIPDESITASSADSSATEAARARITAVSDEALAGAWCSGSVNDTSDLAEPNQDEWLMFDLGTPRTIFGVVTRGRQDYAQWVTSYRVHFTNQLAGNETQWTSYTDPIGIEQMFVGNSDQHSLQTNMLWQPFTAQYVRIVPLAANDNNRCMRADLIGCVDS